MPWENVKDILRPENAHMGVMEVDKDICTSCGLCVDNCPFKAWEMDEDDHPRLKEEYECFSCYNCMVACPVEAISIVEPYHVDDGHWATDSAPLEARMPMDPLNAEGGPDQWNPVEQAVLERRSVRNFKDDPVPEPFIRRVLEAGRFAPSAGNCQPWKFIVLTNKELIAKMDEMVWASTSGLYNMYKNNETVKNLAPMVEEGTTGGLFDPRLALGGMGSVARKSLPASLNAPCVILMAGDERAISGPELNIGIAGQNMNLVANSLGIKACWVGFLAGAANSPEIAEMIGLKPPWRVITTLVMGYPKFKQEGLVPREYRPVTWVREGSEVAEID
ncbi:MAG: nitroreductase family protein [Deltaproteobacteria bacterium]|nr:nitroreductase family protein [Deltaproteobacteria bacterium]MBW2053855.1 nitroreductase family protein [Deltaproteobacteria bacterium]MBW2142572.1 nitroreductase family protein [Deltaproteobacteria bacterium]MBW2322043.1 nitroreductase family protein [Deltaproteobacteria bacterium]